MIVRTIFGAMGTTALVLAGFAPVSAHDGHHDDDNELELLVCVKLDHDHHRGHHHRGHHGDDHGHHHHGHDEVKVKVRTDEERAKEMIENGECERFRLDFDDSEVKVKAFPEDDDAEVRFKVFGDDVDNSWSKDNRLKVDFDDEHNPWVGVVVKVDDHHRHHHHHH